jgi:Skp family chaperone for outer membrane proteins
VPDEPSILLELERAELAARERRLAAEAEAQRLLSDARERAARIERESARRSTDAVAARRRALRRGALAEVRDIEQEIAAIDEQRAAESGCSAPRPAVELVVRAVLGEPLTGERS